MTKIGTTRGKDKSKGKGKTKEPSANLPNKRKPKEEHPKCEKCSDKLWSRTVANGEEQTKLYSRYCERHTCRADLPESVDQEFCPTPKSKKQHYCPDHRKCNRSDCVEYGEHPDWELPFVCSQHQCRREGCITECMLPREWCREHLCSRPNCGFPADTDRRISFCAAHACRVGNCTNSAYDHNGLCPSHLPCTHQGCTAPRKVVDGNRARLHPYCVRHMPCEVASCPNFAQERHTLCNYHSCNMNNCMKQAEDGGSFCADHTCSVSSCLSSIHNVINPESRYCVYHCCKTERCFGEAVSNGGYCSEHVCRVDECNSVRTEHTKYCVDHNCKESNCRYEAMLAGGYCRRMGHGCTEIGCRQRAIGGPSRILQCEDHLSASMRKLGFEEAIEEYRLEKDQLSARINELEREAEDRRSHDSREPEIDWTRMPPNPSQGTGWRDPAGSRPYGMARAGWEEDHPDPSAYRPYGTARAGWEEDSPGPSAYRPYGTARAGREEDRPGPSGYRPYGTTRAGREEDRSDPSGYKPYGTARAGREEDRSDPSGYRPYGTARAGWDEDLPGPSGYRPYGTARTGGDEDLPAPSGYDWSYNRRHPGHYR